jgi:hypothetical protein
VEALSCLSTDGDCPIVYINIFIYNKEKKKKKKKKKNSLYAHSTRSAQGQDIKIK